MGAGRKWEWEWKYAKFVVTAVIHRVELASSPVRFTKLFKPFQDFERLPNLIISHVQAFAKYKCKFVSLLI